MIDSCVIAPPPVYSQTVHFYRESDEEGDAEVDRKDWDVVIENPPSDDIIHEPPETAKPVPASSKGAGHKTGGGGGGAKISRSHKCCVCNRNFKKSSHLKQHMRSHTGT